MKPRIESLDRGLDVLEVLADRGEIGLAELANAVTASRATAFRVLATLQARNYIEHVRQDHVYRLGRAFIGLAAKSHASALITLAAPAMAELRVRTGESVNLAVFRQGQVQYAAAYDGTYGLRRSAIVGQLAPWHATALGKAVLSALPGSQRRALLGKEPFSRYSGHTHTTWAELESDLIATEKRGYSVDDEESEVGAVCIAAPIIGVDGLPLGAISVEGPTTRLAKSHRAALGRTVKDWCRKISAELGYPAPKPKRRSQRDDTKAR
jgi:IclR family acetate operon transcriptional repressor